MRIDSTTSLDELFDLAKSTITELSEGEEFIVKDLFKGYEWNRIAKGNRTKLGAMFYNYALKEGKDSINALDKTLQNQQRYSKE